MFEAMKPNSPCLHAADGSDGAEGLKEAAQGVVISLLILGSKTSVINLWESNMAIKKSSI